MNSRFRVDASARGLRLDAYLASVQEAVSRAQVQRWIAEAWVAVDGALAKASQRLKGGESIEVSVPLPVSAEPEPEAIALAVLHEDADVLVIDKPAGLVVHPGAGHARGTLVNALLHHIQDLQGVGGVLRPGLVHRLDKDTSGLLVVAKNERSLRALQAAFQAREVQKVYRALVWGQVPEEGRLETFYGRHPRQRLKFTGKLKSGKTAITEFQRLRQYALAADLKVLLHTGRTHQIRVHLAEAGFPLLGDPLYGRRKEPLQLIARQALHAERLAFNHPRTGKKMRFAAPLPSDYLEACAGLKKSS